MHAILIMYQATNTYSGTEEQLHSLTSALDGV